MQVCVCSFGLKERRYTDADMRQAIDKAYGNGVIGLALYSSEIISSLHKTQWQVQIEMGEYRLNDDGEPIGFPDMSKPKITNNNSITITKII